jgi:iron complex transport system permease protein
VTPAVTRALGRPGRSLGVGRAVAVGAAALVGAVVVGVMVGQPLSLGTALRDASSIDRSILLRARIPRVLLGAVAGAGLAVTGSAYQALLRNPLAEPYVLGVAGGAALGATLALALGATALATTFGASVTALAAALGGFAATALVYATSARSSSSTGATGRDPASSLAIDPGARGSATAILLAGVVVNAVAAAAITFVKTVVKATVAQQLLFWLSGFLDVPATGTLVVVTLCVALGSTLLVRDAARLNLLALGDEQAAHLGVDVRALERRVFVASSLVVGAIVATCGMIGFVGLLVPHLLRRLMPRGGADYRVLVPASLAGGAAMLVLCDAGARIVYRVFDTEPPVGAITAMLGGPLFLFLLVRRRGR